MADGPTEQRWVCGNCGNMFGSVQAAHEHLVEMLRDGQAHTIIGWQDPQEEFHIGGFPDEAVPDAAEAPDPDGAGWDGGPGEGEGGSPDGDRPARKENLETESMGLLNKKRRKASGATKRSTVGDTPNPAPAGRVPNNTVVSLTGWNIVLPAPAWGLFGFDQAVPLLDEEGAPYPWTPAGFSNWLWDVVRDWHERMMPSMLQAMYGMDLPEATRAARKLLDRFLAMDPVAAAEMDRVMKGAS